MRSTFCAVENTAGTTTDGREQGGTGAATTCVGAWDMAAGTVGKAGTAKVPVADARSADVISIADVMAAAVILIADVMVAAAMVAQAMVGDAIPIAATGDATATDD